MNDDGEEIRRIPSNAEKSSTTDGSSSNGRYRPEDMQERRFMNHLNAYYDEVLACLGDAKAILILGPGEAKGEFQKRLISKTYAGDIAVEPADKMTEPQIVAKVHEYFEKAIARHQSSDQ